MGEISKEIAIYICLMLVLFPYSFISAFYPQIARDKGISLWVIGLVFSMNPAASLFVTLGLGKYMNVIGRKTVVLVGLFFTAISMFLLSPIEYLDSNYVLMLSFASRTAGGIGFSCVYTSVTTIFISDYPDKIQIMLGRMQAVTGTGLILGPLIGAGLYMIDLLVAVNVIGITILILSTIVSKMLGEFKEYKISGSEINRLSLFFKPVFYI
jgi:MFS family permease